jgi:chemotaxis protein histidine kinase CheA
MSDDAQAIQAKVDLMAKVFLGRLPVRYEKMNDTFALCRANPADDANWIELHRLLHSLAGAAGTFGCDDLGEQASLIEMLLADVIKDSARKDEEIDDIARLLTFMQSTS